MADTLATFTTKPIYCGDTAILPIQCRRSDGTTAISLAGASLKASLSRGSTIESTWSIGSGITVTDSPGGNANLVMTQAQTDIMAGNYSLDVVCIEADGTRTTVTGTIQLLEHLTR